MEKTIIVLILRHIAIVIKYNMNEDDTTREQRERLNTRSVHLGFGSLEERKGQTSEFDIAHVLQLETYIARYSSDLIRAWLLNSSAVRKNQRSRNRHYRRDDNLESSHGNFKCSKLDNLIDCIMCNQLSSVIPTVIWY
jgi:hypothetical protein